MKKLSLGLSTLLVTFIGCGGGGNLGNSGNQIGGTSNNSNYSLSRNNSYGATPDNIFQKISSATVIVKTTKRGGTYGWGTGFFIQDDGYIVTNHHVITGAGELQIGINGEERLINAELTAYAECSDLAVIKLTGNTRLPSIDNYISYLDWYPSRVSMGQKIGVIGYPKNSYSDFQRPMLTYNEGVVNTVTYQQSTPWGSTEAFTHSASTTNGNSGGPVIDTQTGKVVGVHYAGSAEDNYRGFAISGVEVENLVNRMINGENIYSIGINPTIYKHSDGRYMGVLVRDIKPNKHADKIDIKLNDIIVEYAGLSLQKDANPNRVKSLEKYCSILRSNNPNDPDNNDIGDVSTIKIQRYTKNRQWVSCVGQINGNKLTLEGNNLAPCPDSGNIQFDEEGFITTGLSSIANPNITYIEPTTTPTTTPSTITKITNKRHVSILKHTPAGICESDYLRNIIIEEGFINPIFREEQTEKVYCSTYGKQNDNNECAITYHQDAHVNTTCVVGFDGYRRSRSSISMSDDSNKFDLLQTMVNDI